MEAAANLLLNLVPLVCLALCIAFFVATLFTRRRAFATCANTFFSLALAWTAIFA
jgi:hypothetical protein